MPKFSNASEETAEMQRREAMETRPQDRYAGRRKFACCRQCGSVDGMRSVCREMLAELSETGIKLLGPWHSELGNDEELFRPCRFCNPDRISDGYEPLSAKDVLAWLDRDPMAPDYAALAAEEPISHS